MTELNSGPPKPGRDKSRMPENSPFFEKVVPILLIGLALVTVVVIVAALGAVLGIWPFN